MILTERYQISSKLRKIPLGSALLRLLYSRVARAIENEPRPQTVLTSEPVCALLQGKPGLTAVDAGTLFNLYFTKVDPTGLAGMINGFLAEAERLHGGTPHLARLKVYFFAMLSDHWCQLVEFGKAHTAEGITLIGTENSAEAKVFAKLAPQGRFHVRTSFTDFVLRVLSRATASAKRRESTDVDRFLQNFSRARALPELAPGKEVIVVNVLEERRFGRLAELRRELERDGLEMLLFCASPKPETIRGLEKFPELKARLVTGAGLIPPTEAREIFLAAQASLTALCRRIRGDGVAKRFLYAGVPLIEAAWQDAEHILLQRGPELALNARLVERALEKYRVKAFLGVDNGTATAAWIDIANHRGIPAFYHFYNALKSPLSYRLLWECLSPTAWVLGSERQEKFFRDSGAPGSQRFRVSGDMFADMIVRCDRASIAQSIRDKAGIKPGEKVVMLLSAYIVADFTLETKRALFQSVAKGAAEIGARLVVKAHPNEKLEILRQQMKDWGLEAPVFHHESIRDVLLASDLACMYASEAAQQAMLAGVPVMALLPDQIRDEMDLHFDYFSTGAVTSVTLGEDSSPAMRSLVFDEGERQKQIERGYAHAEATLGQRDGRNAERFAGIMREFLG